MRSRGWPLVVATLLVAVVALVIARPRGSAQPAPSGESVLQHHKNPSRDGLYVDRAFTRARAVRLHRDPRFHASLKGPTYAQPLYWAASSTDDKDRLFVVTEQNEVSAFDPATGAALWRRTIGVPVPRSRLPCGNIDPLGITGTPIIDASSRTLFVDAMTTPDGGATKKHLVAALSIDDGAMRPGWPADVSGLRSGSAVFDAPTQNQRGALALLGGTLYVPYGGHFGDCGTYHGWVVGIPLANPRSVTAWATRARGGGIWAPGGIATDRHSLFVATGNTFSTSTWADGDAAIRLLPGPKFSGSASDYFAPADWRRLDERDMDLGGSGPVLVRVPGSRPAEFLVALGKDGVAYVIDPARMGGVGRAAAQRHVSPHGIIGAAAAFTTSQAAYVVFKSAGIGCPQGRAGDLSALTIKGSSPPAIAVAWCAEQHGTGSPIVTTTDGRSDPIVWSVGAEGDNRLHGFAADTGDVVFDGGGVAEHMSSVRRYTTPIVAKGRIFVAADDELYAFTPE